MPTLTLKAGGHLHYEVHGSGPPRRDLHRVKCPTFLTCAADDMVTPVHLTRELIAAIPHAQSEILDWGGHFHPVIRPETLREQVLSFFQA